jgi:hypothetical protein
MNELGRAYRRATAKGATATVQVARVIYGTRHSQLQPYAGDASRAPAQGSALGIGPRSVWTGPPRAARPGEPILRRAKP